MAGDIAENIAFVDFHGVGDLGSHWLDGRRVECLDDLFGRPHALYRRSLNDSAAVVVVGPVSFPRKRPKRLPALIVSACPALDRRNQR